MGLFIRKKFKPGKIYSTLESLNILCQEGMENYTLKPKGDGYEIISTKQSREEEKRIRANEREKEKFYDRVQGGGQYRNISSTPSYNNYQDVKDIVK